ncbi:MAG: LamG domain-containing protein [Planctomycetota bacterium]|jgi:hypothetical protein
MYRKNLCRFAIVWLSAAGIALNTVGAGDGYFPSFADKHTVGLWLFDETDYPHTTLTDASQYEYDLRLQNGGRLVPGKFGNALKFSPGSGHAVSYAGFKGAVPISEMRERNGTPSGLWGPAVPPSKILTALAGRDWTVEFWLKLGRRPKADATVIDLGQAYEPGFAVNVAAGPVAFYIVNAYTGSKISWPTTAGMLADTNWHHVAFTHDAATGGIRHYFDGRLLPLPEGSNIPKYPLPKFIIPDDRDHGSMGFSKEKDFEWRRQHRFNFTVGHDRTGKADLDGSIDELRISDVVRYRKNFAPPAGFSRNYGPNAPRPAVANSPPLLFAPDSPKGPVRLGSRKHLFIDDALIDKMQNVRLTCNPPTNRKDLNFRPQKSSWRASVMDVDSKVHIYIPDGYGSEKGITRLRTSEDGISFKAPNLGIIEFEGSKDNDYVLTGAPLYGTFFEDLNPDKMPEERFKMTAWVANRGIYLYFSPDGLRWRRNETCMLPLVSGGGAETYWDDQRGLYVDFIKRDASFRDEGCGGGGRRAVIFQTREVRKTWPFEARQNPYYEGWPMPAVTCEGPIVFAPDKNGQVYRTRAIKYPWAPDTYLAFVWRLGEGERRQVDLGVSRDGVHWNCYADKTWYLTPGQDEEVLSLYGLIRRGDQIWQYFDYGGAHGGGTRRTYARFTQRLDGFVSLDADSQAGSVTTRPLVFEGSKLVLNINAKGSATVAILDEKGRPISGFDSSDCDPITGDYIERAVSWKGNTGVGQLAGKVVRLKFQMQNAKLYAFKFEP